MEKVPKEGLFDTLEALAFRGAFMQPIYGMEAENWIGRSDEEGKFLFFHQERI